VKEQVDRNRRMLEEHLAGASFAAIGARNDISGQRVAQIVWRLKREETQHANDHQSRDRPAAVRA
jgi:hypothetical protein